LQAKSLRIEWGVSAAVSTAVVVREAKAQEKPRVS
jgi:hypothetical protein